MKIQAALFRQPRRRPRFDRIRPMQKQRTPRAVYGVPALCSLLCGLCCGAALQAVFPTLISPGLLQTLTAYFGAEQPSFLSALWCCLVPSVGLGLLILYLGASPVGSPAIVFLLYLRGCGLGALAAYLAFRGKPGLGFYFLCLFPAKSLQICGLFFVARQAMRLSGYYKSCLIRDSLKPEPMARRYLLSCLPGLLILLVSALADVLLYWKVSPSFAALLC